MPFPLRQVWLVNLYHYMFFSALSDFLDTSSEAMREFYATTHLKRRHILPWVGVRCHPFRRTVVDAGMTMADNQCCRKNFFVQLSNLMWQEKMFFTQCLIGKMANLFDWLQKICLGRFFGRICQSAHWQHVLIELFSAIFEFWVQKCV